MTKGKKKIFWSVGAVLLAVLSIWAVLSQAGNLSFHDLRMALRHGDRRWLAAAVLSMMGYIVFEGEGILSILRGVGYHRKHRQGFLYAAGDVYFSAITPSASGGQPASALFMMRNGIPGAVVTATLLMNLVMYTLGIITVGIICMVTAPGLYFRFHLPARILIVLGYLALLLLSVLFMLLLLRKNILERLGVLLLRIMKKIRLIRHPEKKIEKLRKKMDEYGEGVAGMRDHKDALIQAYFWNLAQRISQICVTVFMFLAMGGKITEAFPVWVIQSMVTIGSNTVPIPGGMGVTDYLMLDGFRSLLSNGDAVRLELLSRGLSFYVCVLISGITSAAGLGLYHIQHREEKNS